MARILRNTCSLDSFLPLCCPSVASSLRLHISAHQLLVSQPPSSLTSFPKQIQSHVQLALSRHLIRGTKSYSKVGDRHTTTRSPPHGPEHLILSPAAHSISSQANCPTPNTSLPWRVHASGVLQAWHNTMLSTSSHCV